MNEMDKLTLELFTNKTQYRKYLSKIEPDNYEQEFREKCLEYKDEILKQVEILLHNDDTDTPNYNNFIQDSFGVFAREIIKEIEKKQDYDNAEENDIYDNDNDNDNDDDEILFPPDKMIVPVEKHSFWGKERVIQQNASSDFISHYPTNTSVRRRLIGRRNSILPKDA